MILYCGSRRVILKDIPGRTNREKRIQYVERFPIPNIEENSKKLSVRSLAHGDPVFFDLTCRNK